MTDTLAILVALLAVACFCMVASLFALFLGMAWRIWRSATAVARRPEKERERVTRMERASVGEVKV